MAKLNLLTDTDMALIKQVVSSELQRIQNLGTKNPNFLAGDDQFTPEVYIALTPSNGIAPLSIQAGTSTGTGTGDAPGSAECEIWRIIDNNLTPMDIPDKTVYNISTNVIPGQTWIVVLRTKDGVWLAASAAGPSTTPLISGVCGCFCYKESEYDIIVGGEKTTSRVAVALANLYSKKSEEPYGVTVLPADEHWLDYDSGDGFWSKNVSSQIIGFDSLGAPVTLTVTGAYIKWDPLASPDMRLEIHWPNNLIAGT
jgi:hypothetical protein